MEFVYTILAIIFYYIFNSFMIFYIFNAIKPLKWVIPVINFIFKGRLKFSALIVCVVPFVIWSCFLCLIIIILKWAYYRYDLNLANPIFFGIVIGSIIGVIQGIFTAPSKEEEFNFLQRFSKFAKAEKSESIGLSQFKE